MEQRSVISFHGLTPRTGPITWGQRHIWSVFAAHPDSTEQFTLHRCWRVASGFDSPRVLAALRALVERHEALRSHLTGPPGDFTQQVRGEGRLAVTVEQRGSGVWSDDEAVRAARELARRRFHLDGEFPVRFRVLASRHGVEWVVVAVSHLAVDGQSLTVMEDDFTALLLAPDTLEAPTCQPVEWAGRERSPAGARAQRRSLRYTSDLLRRYSEPLFPGSGSEQATGSGFPVVLGHGTGLGASAKGLAERWKVPVSALATAALARALSRHSGNAAFPLGVTSSNRALPDANGYVGMLAQNTVIGVDVSGLSWRDLSVGTWRSLLAAHAHAAYDQAVMGSVLAETNTDFDYLGFGAVGHFVNFVQSQPDTSRPEGRATPSISLSEAEPANYRIPRFGVVVSSDSVDLKIRVFADPAALPNELAKSVAWDFLEHFTDVGEL